jgi:hypothetical protein
MVLAPLHLLYGYLQYATLGRTHSTKKLRNDKWRILDSPVFFLHLS